MPRVSFGIATAPQRVDYADLLRVWREADTVPEIEHAWTVLLLKINRMEFQLFDFDEHRGPPRPQPTPRRNAEARSEA